MRSSESATYIHFINYPYQENKELMFGEIKIAHIIITLFFNIAFDYI